MRFRFSLSTAGCAPWRWLACAVLPALVACAHAPGMHIDADSEAARSRIDYRPLDEQTLAELQQPAHASPVSSSHPALFTVDGPPPGSYQYLVAPGDVLRITVWEHPELTNPSGTDEELSGRIVNGDGSLYFPYAGLLQAAGKTVQQIREEITRGLRSVIRSPKVDVSVMQYRGQRVFVSGQVRNPGLQQVTDVPPDLADILARAGGVTEDADLGAVLITRGQAQARVDLEALYYRGDVRANLRLRHGDIVNVPQRHAARVYVTGEVVRPQRLLMPRGVLTLADALAEAGGINPTAADASQVYVIRDQAGGRPLVYHLNARSPEALLSADRFPLRSRDVVYVDAAPVVRWSRLISNILPSATVLRESLNDTTRAFPR